MTYKIVDQKVPEAKQLKSTFAGILGELKALFSVSTDEQKDLLIQSCREMTDKVCPSLPDLEDYYCLRCWHKLTIKDHVNKVCEQCKANLFEPLTIKETIL